MPVILKGSRLKAWELKLEELRKSRGQTQGTQNGSSAKDSDKKHERKGVR